MLDFFWIGDECVFICLSACLPACLAVWLSVSLAVYLSISVYVYMFRNPQEQDTKVNQLSFNLFVITMCMYVCVGGWDIIHVYKYIYIHICVCVCVRKCE